VVGATRFGQRISLLVATLFVSIFTFPSVSAAPFDNISKAMGTVWNAMGAVFSFQYVSGSPAIQEGILKFLIFILLLRIVMSILQKLGEGKASWLDAKTSGIIGFVVAAITVLFTPNVFIFSSIVLLLVPLLLVVGGYAWVFKGKTDAEKTNPWLATLILFILFLLLSFLQENLYKPGSIAVGKMYPFANTVMDLLVIITIILFVWKLFAAIFTIGGAGGASWGKIKETLDTPIVDRPPSAPSDVDFTLEAPDRIKITWGEPPVGEKDQLKRYWVEHRYDGEKWKDVDKNRSVSDPREIIIGAVAGTPLDVSRRMQIQIRTKTRNSAFAWSAPGASNVKVPGPKTISPAAAHIVALRSSVKKLETLIYPLLSTTASPPLALIKFAKGKPPIFNKIIKLSTLSPAQQGIVKARLAAVKAELGVINAELAHAQAAITAIQPHHATLSPSDLADVFDLIAETTRYDLYRRTVDIACAKGVLP